MGPMIFTGIMVLLWVAVVAFTYNEGMWNNFLRIVNVLIAGLTAFAYFRSLGALFQRMYEGAYYYYDFISLWLIFTITYAVLAKLTGLISPVRVRFKKVTDAIGSWVCAIVLGFVLISFGMATLHASPLAENFCFGGFQPDRPMVLGLAPDRRWLILVDYTSNGALSRFAPVPFDWREYIAEYNDRRAAYEKHLENASGLGDLLVSGPLK